MTHTISFRIPEVPNEAVLLLDGKPLEGVFSIVFMATAQKQTVASIKMYCNVEIDGEFTLQTERWSIEKPPQKPR